MSHSASPDYETLATLLVDTTHLPEEVRLDSFGVASEFIEEETGSKLAGDIQRFTLDAMSRASEFLGDAPNFKTEKEQQSALEKASIKAVAVELEEALGAVALESSPKDVVQETPPHHKRKPKKRSNLARTLARERRARQSIHTEKMVVDMSEGWEEFHSDDLVLRPEVHHRGPYVDIHLSTNASRKEHGNEHDLLIKYTKSRENDPRVRLAGFEVPEDMRGQKLGLSLYEYFRNGLEAKGLIFDGTELIRKPSIARLMLELGLKPESTAIVAEVLPREIWADENTPSVIIRKGREQERHKRRQSNRGNYRFYDVVEAEGIPVDVDKVVPLHTRWVERAAQDVADAKTIRS